MPMSRTVQKLFDMMGNELRGVDSSSAHALLGNVQNYIRQMRKYCDMPPGAPNAIRDLEMQTQALAVALRQFGDAGERSLSPAEMLRSNAFDAADRLGLLLQDAKPSETARALGVD